MTAGVRITPSTPARRSRRWLPAAAAAVAVATVAVLVTRHRAPAAIMLPLREAARIALPGDSSRLDYASLEVAGRAHLADGAHVVAVDRTTGRAYFPVPDAGGGRPGLLITEPTAGRRSGGDLEAPPERE
jgi:hypothetical protein